MLSPGEFLRRVPDAVRPQLTPALSSFRSATRFSLAQLWYGNKLLHYEVWIRARERRLELGLHFEADPLTNARLLAAFRTHERAVHRALGDEALIEQWDKGWARIWEPVALPTLDAPFLAVIARRIAGYMTALEPMLRDELPAGVAWSERRAPQRAATAVRAKQRR